MSNAEKMTLFKMRMTADAKNIKDLIGQTVQPAKWNFSNYTDSDETIHTVLALDLRFKDGHTEMYRTEVRAFIDKFNVYAEVFGDEPEAELPWIVITGKSSQRGNKYVNFDIVE